MKANSQRTKDSMLKRLREAGFELETLTAGDYHTEIKNRLRWSESTYKTALCYLGKIEEADKLISGFRDYIPTDREANSVRQHLGPWGVLLVQFGLRFSEVWDLEYSDPETRTRLALRPLKGGKPFIVTISDLPRSTQAAIQQWLNGNERKLTTPKQIRKRWARLKEIGLLSKECVPHSFRHRLVTRLIDKNTPIDTVKRLVGHSRRETTERYYTSDPTTTAKLYATLE